MKKQMRACSNRGDRITQIVPKHRDELLAQFSGPPLMEKQGLAGREPLNGIEMKSDQFCKKFEHADRFGCPQPGGRRVDRAQRSEKGSAGKDDRHRDIALEAIHRGRGMSAIFWVFGDVVDNNGFTALPDFVTDSGFDLEFAAGRKPELNVVAYGAGNPTILAYFCNRGETHACYAANDVEDRLHSRDALNCRDIC